MDVAWNLSALSRYANTAEGREVAGNHSAARAKVANVPQCRQTFVLQHRIVTLIARNRTESPLHSGFVGRPPATLEKRIPINPNDGGARGGVGGAYCAGAAELVHCDGASPAGTPLIQEVSAFFLLKTL